MSGVIFRTVTILLLVKFSLSARILGYFTIPSISHQAVFRPLMQELAKRGHEVVIVTTDPAFKADCPDRLTEVDVHDISYNLWAEHFIDNKDVKLNAHNMLKLIEISYNAVNLIFLQQLQQNDVKAILNGKQKFDLIFIDATHRPTLILTEYFKAPVIEISTLVGFYTLYKQFGVPSHPLIYPQPLRHKIYNLTFLEKLQALKEEYDLRSHKWYEEEWDNKLLKKHFGKDAPSIAELVERVTMIFVNANPIFEGNIAVPPGVIHLGGLHQRFNTSQELPEELKSYLDSSKHGVIYMSFGTNLKPSLLPIQMFHVFNAVFSKLPYDVILKWDQDSMPGKPKNMKISKWLPQSVLLKHPKVKLFITQGGMQSTDEAITAGVPLLGIPMLGDQWYNAEKYLHFGIGKKLEFLDVTEQTLEAVIKDIINDDSYRENIVRLRDLMNDQPQSPLERAVWWSEYVIRHKGAKHLRSPMANISWAEYLVLDVVLFVLGLFVMAGVTLYMIVSALLNCNNVKKGKIKVN